MARQIPNPTNLIVAALAALAVLAPAGCKEEDPPPSRPAREDPNERQRRPGGMDFEQQDARRRVSQGSGGMIGVGFQAKHYAERQACLRRLQSLHKAARMFAAVEGRFPASLKEFEQSGMVNTGMLICPLDDRPYSYTPGLDSSMGAKCVMFYEPDRTHETYCQLVYLDGTTAKLSEEDLDKALEATRQAIAGTSARTNQAR